MTVEIMDHIQDAASEKLAALLEKIICYAVEKESERTDFEVSLTLTNNDEIRTINREQRNIDSATDVLSFPLLDFSDEEEQIVYPNPETDDIMLGDIVISLEQARTQAAEYDHSFEREAAYLCVHGVLHLLGYDHLNEEDKQLMRIHEEEILSSYGLVR